MSETRTQELSIRVGEHQIAAKHILEFRDSDGNTVFHLAAALPDGSEYKTTITSIQMAIESLIEKNLDEQGFKYQQKLILSRASKLLSLRNKHENSALILTAQNDHFHFITDCITRIFRARPYQEAILENIATRFTNNLGDTILHRLAATPENEHAIQLLNELLPLNRYSSSYFEPERLVKTNKDGNSAFAVAAASNNINFFLRFIDFTKFTDNAIYGKETTLARHCLNVAGKDGQKPILIAILKNNSKLVKLIFPFIEPKIPSEINNNSPLIFATAHNLPEMVSLLLRLRKNPNTVDEDHKIPLLRTQAKENLAAIELALAKKHLSIIFQLLADIASPVLRAPIEATRFSKLLNDDNIITLIISVIAHSASSAIKNYLLQQFLHIEKYTHAKLLCLLGAEIDVVSSETERSRIEKSDCTLELSHLLKTTLHQRHQTETINLSNSNEQLYFSTIHQLIALSTKLPEESSEAELNILVDSRLTSQLSQGEKNHLFLQLIEMRKYKQAKEMMLTTTAKITEDKAAKFLLTALEQQNFDLCCLALPHTRHLEKSLIAKLKSYSVLFLTKGQLDIIKELFMRRIILTTDKFTTKIPLLATAAQPTQPLTRSNSLTALKTVTASQPAYTNKKGTFFQLAVILNQYETVKWLLESELSSELTTLELKHAIDNISNPETRQTGNQYQRLVQLLNEALTQRKIASLNPLHLAVSRFIDTNNFQTFKDNVDSYLATDPTTQKPGDINTLDTNRDTALIRLAQHDGAGLAIEFLLRQNADPNKQDNLGRTALYHAVKLDLISNITALIDSEATDSNLADRNVNTPAHIVHTMTALTALTKYKLKPDFNRQNSQGATALLNAITARNTEIATYLLQQDEALKIPDHTGAYPVHIAAAKSLPILKLILMAHPIQATQLNSLTGDAPIHYAARQGNLETLNHLIATIPQEIAQTNYNQQTFLHTAIESKSYNVIIHFETFFSNSSPQEAISGQLTSLINSLASKKNNAVYLLTCQLLMTIDEMFKSNSQKDISLESRLKDQQKALEALLVMDTQLEILSSKSTWVAIKNKLDEAKSEAAIGDNASTNPAKKVELIQSIYTLLRDTKIKRTIKILLDNYALMQKSWEFTQKPQPFPITFFTSTTTQLKGMVLQIVEKTLKDTEIKDYLSNIPIKNSAGIACELAKKIDLFFKNLEESSDAITEFFNPLKNNKIALHAKLLAEFKNKWIPKSSLPISPRTVVARDVQNELIKLKKDFENKQWLEKTSAPTSSAPAFENDIEYDDTPLINESESSCLIQ